MSPRIYVGNLPMDIHERDLEDLFGKYGRIRTIDLKQPPRPPAFCFITYEDPRDAEDAVHGRDGFDIGDGMRLRVELARFDDFRGGERGYDHRERGYDRGRGGGGGGGGYGGERRGYGEFRGGRGGGGGRFEDDYHYHRRGGGGGGGRFGGYGGGRGGPPAPRGGGRRSEYQVIVTGLPGSASWQDLKDHMRQVGDVCYTDVDRRGGGIVEYIHEESMHRALKKLDHSEFRNPFDASEIRVRLPKDSRFHQQQHQHQNGGGGRGSGGSRSRSRSRGRGGGRYRGGSPSQSRSASRRRHAARSASAASSSRQQSEADSPPRRRDRRSLSDSPVD